MKTYLIKFLTKTMGTVETTVEAGSVYAALKAVSCRRDYDVYLTCEALLNGA